MTTFWPGTQPPSWFRYKDGAGIEYIPRAGAPEYDAGMQYPERFAHERFALLFRFYERIPISPDLCRLLLFMGKTISVLTQVNRRYPHPFRQLSFTILQSFYSINLPYP